MATTALIDYSKTYAEMQGGSSEEIKLLIAKAVTAMFYMLKNQAGDELHEENAMHMCRLALVELKRNLRPEYTESQLLEYVILDPEHFYKTGINYWKNSMINFLTEKN